MQSQFLTYLQALKSNFTKLAKLEFLQSDNSVAFSIDNNPKNKRSSALIQDGNITVNLQNGSRRKASVTLSNITGEYDYNLNKVWFGDKIRLLEGLVLPNGSEYYLPQGVFYVKDPQEAFKPNGKYAYYDLVDKWSYLNNDLFGNLEGTYEIPVNSNIFSAATSILQFDRGNGTVIDNVTPIFTDYYNGKYTTLPDGTQVPLTNTPYTVRKESGATYADVMIELNTMLAGWIGYDQTGRLRLDPSQDDILDTSKPIQYAFTPSEKQFLGATYQIKNSETYNDIIVRGESLDKYGQVAGRATNMDATSDLNIYGKLGKRTLPVSGAGFYTNKQCEDYAAFLLKRYSTMKKAVTIESTQMFHLIENNLVTVRRVDKPGTPVERHLITGFTRPIAQTGNMTINCTSVNDYPVATITPLPGA